MLLALQARRHLALERSSSEGWHVAAPVLGGKSFLLSEVATLTEQLTHIILAIGLTWVVVFTLANVPPVVRLIPR